MYQLLSGRHFPSLDLCLLSSHVKWNTMTLNPQSSCDVLGCKGITARKKLPSVPGHVTLPCKLLSVTTRCPSDSMATPWGHFFRGIFSSPRCIDMLNKKLVNMECKDSGSWENVLPPPPAQGQGHLPPHQTARLEKPEKQAVSGKCGHSAFPV